MSPFPAEHHAQTIPRDNNHQDYADNTTPLTAEKARPYQAATVSSEPQSA
jgi:hypothetical protein